MNEEKVSNLKDVFRAGPWLFITLAILSVMFFYSPQHIGVLAYNMAKISMGAYVGYWIDRSVFYYARPYDMSEDKYAFVHSCYRRAMIIASTIAASGLAL